MPLKRLHWMPRFHRPSGTPSPRGGSSSTGSGSGAFGRSHWRPCRATSPPSGGRSHRGQRGRAAGARRRRPRAGRPSGCACERLGDPALHCGQGRERGGHDATRLRRWQAMCRCLGTCFGCVTRGPAVWVVGEVVQCRNLDGHESGSVASWCGWGSREGLWWCFPAPAVSWSRAAQAAGKRTCRQRWWECRATASAILGAQRTPDVHSCIPCCVSQGVSPDPSTYRYSPQAAPLFFMLQLAKACSKHSYG